MGAYEILIQGNIIANGTEADSIVFTSAVPGVSSSARQIRFEGSVLDSSQMSYVIMEYASRAIQIGEETEHAQGGKNQGTLTVSHVRITRADVITDGYVTGAKLLLSDAVITSSTIKGTYPRSEEIIIQNAIISDCIINSDSYNAGITILNSYVTNSQFTIGCCGANIHLKSSILIGSSVQEGGGSPVTGPLEILDSRLITTPVNLPSASVSVTNSVINYSSTLGIKFGNGTIANSSIIGVGDGVGVEITGFAGYNIGGSVTVSNSTILQNAVGVKFTGANIVTIQSSNILDNHTYNIENLTSVNITATNNYWGLLDSAAIAATVFDYYDDINYGIVDYSNYQISPSINAPVLPPRQVVKSALGPDVQLLWRSNLESDLAGYRVYFGSPAGYSFTNMVDVGVDTSYTLIGVSETDTIAITTYDSEADSVNDQIEGHESWFAYAVIGDIVGIDDKQSEIPEDYSLSYAWPNPFNPQTTIGYSLPKNSDVTLIIYNLQGQEIIRWSEDNISAGFYEKTWKGKNKYGAPVASGVYLYRLQAGDFVQARKMILLK